MAKKKELVREQEQFLVRLPSGMRDRIKAKAERAGMSMNEAIVWVLERQFPAPMSLDAKLEELADLASMLKTDGDAERVVDRLIGAIHETVTKISDGKLPAPVDFRASVAERLDRWETEQYENAQDDDHDPFSDEVVIPAKTDWKDDDGEEGPFGEPI